MKRFWQRLSRRERALAGATLVIVLLFMGQSFVLTPYLERRAWVKGQLEIQPQLLEKNLRYLSHKEEMSAALERARNELKEKEPRLLNGDTASVSASDLQETVQALATKEGTQVITTRVLNPEPAGSFSKIAIQMEIGGQIDQLANLIRGIESSPKQLLIDEINVRSLFRPIGLPQVPGIPQPSAQNLRVSLTVAGYSRGQPAAAAKPDGSERPMKNGNKAV
ncbi:MAG TPA: type II secretion system protein GspM [Candidatus Binatia bacterium]|jgi:ACT domain-containing protein